MLAGVKKKLLCRNHSFGIALYKVPQLAFVAAWTSGIVTGLLSLAVGYHEGGINTKVHKWLRRQDIDSAVIISRHRTFNYFTFL